MLTIFFSGLSLWQAKGLAEYLRAKGAISEDKAIKLPKNIRRKYILGSSNFLRNAIKSYKGEEILGKLAIFKLFPINTLFEE